LFHLLNIHVDIMVILFHSYNLPNLGATALKMRCYVETIPLIRNVKVHQPRE